MKNFRGNKGIFIMLMMVLLVVGYYSYLSNRTKEEESQIISETKLSPVEEVLAMDLNRNYPSTPREVVKCYAEITKCFYNETYSDEQLKLMGSKIQELYDADLVTKQGTSYQDNLKTDVALMKSQGTIVSGYKTSASTDVEYFTKDERDCAGLYCIFTLRNGTATQATQEVFILRKDDKGHWKILGWDVAPEEK